jgi:phosphoribosylformylglycinamidine synthase
VHLHAFMEKPERLRDYGIVVFPGGFTYGDDIASGVVFAVEMRERVLPEVRKVVADGGLVLGICNGFQILTRSGLLPATGPADGAVEASLQPNESGRFECRWVQLEAATDRCAFLQPGQVIECPVAHAEGRFVTADDTVRERMKSAGQLALRYTGPDGGDAAYPWNPNGSHDGIAGVCDPTGRVLGLMPHPERNVEPWHHPRWTRGGGSDETGGLALFHNAVRAAR